MTERRPSDAGSTPPPNGGGTHQGAERLIAIVGPTATGKTALAVRLAERLAGEVIGADSRQLYRGMDIGTAKPTAEERERPDGRPLRASASGRVRHHLIDVAEPDETFNLGRYLDLADDALQDCWSRGVVPLLVGGTGQYIWALLEGWQVPRVPPDRRLRAELEEKAEREGVERLAEELAQVDPETAARIDQRNVRRIIRALEVFRVTGRPLSAWQARRQPEFAATIIGLDCPRDELYRRIDARVDAMLAAGLVDEVQGLIDSGYSCDLPAMSGIGYRQVCQHLAGELTLDEAIARIKTETHRLARMQHTWFRRDDPRIRWIDVTAAEPLAETLCIVESEMTFSSNV